jgi:ATP-dependent protease ClpP protease subunit
MDGTELIRGNEIVLDGDVVPDEWARWYEGGAFSAAMVSEALAAFEGEEAVVRVNSPGGSPFEGEAIRAALASHKGGVRVIVAGLAASAASLLVMGAKRIEITSGSLIMIHDPSSFAAGNAEALRRVAAGLDVSADTYAAVYAARTGLPVEEVRQMMKDETWLGPARAVSLGFADAVNDGEADDYGNSVDPVDPAIMSAKEAFRACAARMSAAVNRAALPSKPSAARGQNPARMAAGEEVTSMTDKTNTPAAATPVPATPPSAQTMTAPSSAEILAAERARQSAIRMVARPFMEVLGDERLQAILDSDKSVDAAKAEILDAVAMAAPSTPRFDPTGGTPRASITRDETDTQVEGMIGALMGKADGPAVNYRGLRLKSLAMHLAGPSRRGFSDHDTIRAGLTATSMMGGAYGVGDFAYITGEVMNRTILAAYQLAPATWRAVTGEPMEAADFRELHSVRFGGDLQLLPLTENGELKQAIIKDEGEGLKVERRGRQIKITFEAVVNDDMGVFSRLPRDFANSARIMENSMVWSLIRSNAKLKSDNKALFHADHKNLAASGAALSPTTFAAARKAISEQRALGVTDPDAFLGYTVDQLIVPPELEQAALQFVGVTVPTKDSDANPYKTTTTAIVVPQLGAAAGGSATAWYAGVAALPPITAAYLSGYGAPTVETVEGMSPRGVTMNAEHIFGAAATEFRGIYKNAGA